MTSVSPLAATAGPTPAQASSSPLASTDFETFLKMLTTQLQNQDPLNPMESTDFAVQLATFSGVEQQVQTNQLLGKLTDSLGLSGVGKYAGWIGMEAKAPAPVAFDGSPVNLSIGAAKGADTAVLVVSDSSGKVVQRLDVGTGEQTLAWDGVGEGGTMLGAGVYSFTLQSYSDGALLGSAAVERYGKVTEIRTGTDGAVALVLDGSVTVAASDVTGLRPAE